MTYRIVAIDHVSGKVTLTREDEKAPVDAMFTIPGDLFLPEVEKEKPPGRPGWVPEGAVRMLYVNPAKKKQEEIWIQPELGVRMLYTNMSKAEEHLYAVNKGWVLKRYLREWVEVNEFGPVSP